MIDIYSSLEAILFAAGEPVPAARISLVLNVSEDEVYAAAGELEKLYEKYDHSLRVLRLNDKLQICTAPEYNAIITKILEQRKPPSLSQSALETLAIVAYYQPATNAYISRVRGVDSTYTISSLTEKGLIEPKGRLEAPGRPTLYGTTDLFLRTMGVTSLDELPRLPDMAESESVAKLQETISALKKEQNVQLSIEDLEALEKSEENTGKQTS